MNNILESGIYFSSLAACIAIGSSFKAIDDVDSKKSYGAGLGLLIVCLVCREYFFHSILMVLGNVIIIKSCSKRYIHQVSLVYTFIYLVYLNVNFNLNKYMAWIFQILALRLVGLAFELHLAERARMTFRIKTSLMPNKFDKRHHLFQEDPSPMEVISYAYFFVGIHKGPYYNQKIFSEYFEIPYPTMSDYRAVTVGKMKKILFCTAIYLVLLWQFPISAYNNDEFYKNKSSEYRFFYNIPQLAQFILQQQILLGLCTCVCAETGLGVYPAKWLSVPGLGPQLRYNSDVKIDKTKLKETDDDVSEFEEFSFSTVKCFDNNKLIFGPMMKDSFRGWDMSTQNWFWAYIYKDLLKSTKEMRSACSFLTWSVFCGPTAAQTIFSITLWVCLNLESELHNIYKIADTSKAAWRMGYSIIRAVCITYLTPCLILDDATVIKYYTSIYWSLHVLLLITIAVAVGIIKVKGNYAEFYFFIIFPNKD